MQILARRYDTRQVIRLHIDSAAIGAIEEIDPSDVRTEIPYIGPGLIDLQVNGYCGIAFNSPSLKVQDVATVSRSLDAHGVTGFCPTVTTDSFSSLQHAIRTIATAMQTNAEVQARVAGIHLEGPYISPDDGPRGAHPREHVRPPDWDEFQSLQESAHGNIRITTLSPEYPTAPEFISRVVASGVLVAIGHTNATSTQIQAAVDAGARLSTHLGNGAHGQICRHPNYIWDQLAEDRLMASLIVDGHHLPPAVIKSFLRAKTPERCILVSDMTALAGLEPGQYEETSLGAVEVLEDGRLVIAGQRQLLAGAALPITTGISNVLCFTDSNLQDAVDMASIRPATLINAPVGRLQVGAPADLTLFRLVPDCAGSTREDFQIVGTVNAGALVWERQNSSGFHNH